MPNTPFTKTLNGSGALAEIAILEPRDGLFYSIRLSKNGQTNNPVVTVKKFPSGEVLVDGITLNATASYYPRAAQQTPAAVSYALPTPFALGGFAITLTVSGGDAAGVVSGYIEWIS